MSKAVRFLLAGCIAFVLLLGSFTGGLAVGWFLPRNNPLAAALKQKTPASQDTPGNPSSQPTDQLFAPFWEAWSLVHKQYVDQPVNDLELMRGAIRGMLAALGDRHSSYMDPDQFRMLNTDLGQEYEGIGAYVDVTGEYMIIISPMPGSPAEKAGLKSGDMIIKVDGEDMTGIDGNLVLKRVLGPAGTQVTLTIARKGEQAPFDVTITRAKIKIVTTESKMLDNGIGYIKLTSFGENTNKELIKAITGIKAKNPKGLILDLRGNGGGYLDTAIQVVSQFVGKGTVVSEVYGDGQKKTEQVLPGGLATDIPLVVLVNEGSASASEITAGAIQDYGRGKLVGVKTYGKGSVQIVNTLKTDGGAVRITVAHWLTPNGRQIDKKGLEPDIEIQLSEDDIKAGKDPQLDKAIEVLLQGQ
jgi:carboxyl-terminal processing protease